MARLTQSEIDTVLREAAGWQNIGGTLAREWVFPGFPKAIAFVNRVAELAEQSDHHPDIDIRYNRVRLVLTSHDAGALTERDARMARTLSRDFPDG